MKRKILIFATIMVLLTGCGNKQTKEIENNVVDEINNLDLIEDEIELYSDDNKIVFENGNSRLVFYYKNNKITGYHTYIDYGTLALAQAAHTALEIDDTIDKAYTRGRYLIIEFNESQYEDLSVDDVKFAYSYLKELKENQ